MISIVSAYHNRKNLLFNTLKSLENSNYKDFEFILVDDCSDDQHRVEEFCELFPFLKIVRLEKKDKWYINPCAVFNKGFKEVKGEIVIIQNPECLHIGDVLSFASKIKDEEYISFSCYSINKEKTENLTNLIHNTNDLNNESLLKLIQPEYKSVGSDGDNGWYNHPVMRPVGYHFCSAITTKNLYDLGGFDERYAMGISYDDDEFLIRIRKKGLKIKIITHPFVTHQWHYSGHNYQNMNINELVKKNRDLLQITINQPSWIANK
jgi:glycosyltransferase involved in cell wall biosynthesis